MGVMGQIYGSRVVVGLAAPSPAALGAVGKMLVKFNSSMYTTFNKNRIQAAGKSKASAQKELETAKEQLNKYQKSTGQLISQGAKTSYNRIAKMAGNKGPALAAKNSIESLGRAMAAAGAKFKPKLMAKTGNFTQPAKQAAQLFKNLSSMDRTHQKEVVKWMKHRHDGQVRAVKTMVREGELRKYTKEELAKEIELLVKYDNEYKEINEAVTDNFTILDKITDEERKHKKIIDEKAKAAKKAEDLYQKELKDSARAVKLVAQKTKELVQTLKTGFTEAVQNSTVALTAFYYKLNQSTETLITFERELLNANSVFNITREELFKTGDEIVQFGQKFGMEMQNGATGLYQLASAGLSANEALQVLPNTLKLSMAVQGDHNTISKLTAQTIMGFGMAFEDSGIIVDKFAHSIQKSLIEYQDLASAVKFALPFFTTTGQSIDQLLGALEVLTNRALEAGIAGRGLRQGLAELAESLGDNTAAFKKLGVEVSDSQGNMLQLTEIAANFADVLEEGVINDTELLTTLIEDLNVRGATAFVHLVQASDEFTEAVSDLENAGGELDEMVRIQNESLGAQIQILKNNVQAVFLLRDAEYESELYMNRFHEAVVKLVEQFQALLVVETENGYVLTEFGRQLQEIAISGVYMFVDLAKQLVEIVKEFTTAGKLNLDILKLYTVPLKIIMDAFQMLGPEMQRVVIYMHMLNKIVPFQALAMMAYATAYSLANAATIKATIIAIPNQISQLADAGLKAVRLFLLTQLNRQTVVEVTWTNLSTMALIRKNIAMAAGVIWTGLLFTGTVLLTLVTGGLATSMTFATAATWALWGALTLGLVLVIAGLIKALYDINKEFDIFGTIVGWVSGVFTTMGEIVRGVWEESIYPFIYRVGMEFRALAGILGLAIAGIVERFKSWEVGGKNVLGSIKWLGKGLINFLLLPMKVVLKAVQSLIAGFELLLDVIHHVSKGQFGRAGAAGAKFLAKMVDIWGSNWATFGEGGYIKAMARGGVGAGDTMNIVGEKGPEIFMPSQSGQIINSRRTQEILYDIKRRAGVGAAGAGMAKTIIVNEIVAQKAVNRNTRMSVDTFAGVV